jgi:hypothetical protein
LSQKDAAILKPVTTDGWWHISLEAELDPSYFHLSDPSNMYLCNPRNIQVAPRANNALPDMRRF